MQVLHDSLAVQSLMSDHSALGPGAVLHLTPHPLTTGMRIDDVNVAGEILAKQDEAELPTWNI